MENGGENSGQNDEENGGENGGENGEENGEENSEENGEENGEENSGYNGEENSGENNNQDPPRDTVDSEYDRTPRTPRTPRFSTGSSGVPTRPQFLSLFERAPTNTSESYNNILSALNSIVDNTAEVQVQFVTGFEQHPIGSTTPPQNRTSVSQLLQGTTTEIFAAEDDSTHQSQDESSICSICHGSFDANSIIRRITGCNHYFHINCLENWLQNNNTCPNCRNTLE
tara:strand:+ start:170 stop:850 length:681 start_codon:yes stop_codon:yes gene_type:complete